jgi:hypothetical protein
MKEPKGLTLTWTPAVDGPAVSPLIPTHNSARIILPEWRSQAFGFCESSLALAPASRKAGRMCISPSLVADSTYEMHAADIKKLIQQEIAGILATIKSLRKEISTLRDQREGAVRHGRKRSTVWVKQNAVALTAVLVAVGGVAIQSRIATQAWKQPQEAQRSADDLRNQIDRQIDAKLASPLGGLQEQRERLARIEGKLDGIMSLVKPLAARKLKESVALVQTDFKKDLGEIGTSLTIAKEENIKVGAGVIEAIRERMLGTLPDTLSYWQAAAAPIRYRSPVLPPNMPPCEIHDYSGEYSSSVAPDKKLPGEIAYMTVSGCTAFLDGQSIARMRFQKVRVVYNGGPVKFGKNVSFVDCEFDIRLPLEPPPDGRRLTNTLLAQTSTHTVHID